MSKEIVANNGAVTQGPAEQHRHIADLVELHFLKPIAVALHRCRQRNDAADFDQDLTADEKTALIREAAIIARRQDDRYTKPAIYFVADCVTRRGVGSLTRDRREEVVGCLAIALRAYEQALCDQAPAATLESMRKLSEADAEAQSLETSTVTKEVQ